MTPDQQSIQQQIESDPRIQQWAQERGAGFIGADILRQFGYDVPATATFRTGLGGRGSGYSAGDGFWGGVAKAIPVAAGALGSFGVGSMLGGGAGASGGAVGGDVGGMVPTGTSVMGGAGALEKAYNGASGGGLMGALKGLVDSPGDIASLGGMIAALAGGARGGNGQASEDAQRLNQITEQRMKRVDPLHQAVTQLAWGRLPTNARQGIAPPTYSPLT
jgi:hypothetical protein